MSKILGISAFYHDSAAALIVDGIIVAAAQEERFTRKKHDENFPVNAIKYCLNYQGISIDELDTVVFYDKPFLKFERLLETFYAFAPKGLVSFIHAIPIWVREKLFFKKLIKDGLSEVGTYNHKELKLKFTEHHLSHAASAFYPSPFLEAVILTIDGVGEWCTTSIGYGSGNTIEFKAEMHFPHSVGLLYSACTYFLGFKVNAGEYKLMGLAPYGNPHDDQVESFIDIIQTKLLTLHEDGSIILNLAYFNYTKGLTMIEDQKWAELFGFKRRLPEAEIDQVHCNFALAIQKVTENIVLRLAKTAKQLTNSDYLCLAGGVALNCVANGKLAESGLFKSIYIQPASGDAGGAIGAALAYHHIARAAQRNETSTLDDGMSGAYLGPEFSDLEIDQVCRKYDAHFEQLAEAKLYAKTAQAIADGKVVGWFQGRMEFGPRALGNRSILGNARDTDMQQKINLKIKYREGFRPFAPSVLAENAQQYFGLTQSSPYMLLVAPVHDFEDSRASENQSNFSLNDLLKTKRSELQAITHVDGSARVQTVTEKSNRRFYQLLQAVKQTTGHGVVINTSFNVRGEPIVCSPDDAYRCFRATEMDVLVINNHYFEKTKQHNWSDTQAWQQQFEQD